MNKKRIEGCFDIDCKGKTIKQKKVLWTLLKKQKYSGCSIETGMFSRHSGWYNANFFLVYANTVHPRTGNSERKSYTYNEYMKMYGEQKITNWQKELI